MASPLLPDPSIPAPEATLTLRQAALQALTARDPDEKIARTRALHAQASALDIGDQPAAGTAPVPGQPPRPELRVHLDVPKRSPFTPEGLAALLHAITHIEFNAINMV